jgi:nucleoside phosphorylase
MKRYFDVGVIVPLEEELLEFQRVFHFIDNLSLDTALRYSFNTDTGGLTGIVVQQEDMGKTHALRSTNCLLEDFDIGLLVCLGIAGGLSSDVNIGDVCYSDRIIDVYDNAKITEKKRGKIEIEFSPNNYLTDRQIVASFNFCRTLPELQPKYLSWQESRLQAAKKLIPGTFTGRDGPQQIAAPNTISGKVVCASVSKSPGYNEAILKLERKILAIETESGGVFEAAGNVPAVAIRGISDYADLDKNKLEKETHGNARALAAQNASHFLKLQLQNPYFEKYLLRLRGIGPLVSKSNTPAILGSKPSVPALLEAVANKIDTTLRDISQEYRLQKQGYVLPIPRVRIKRSAITQSPKKVRNRPLDFREVVAENSCAIVGTSRNYPDKGLPWILANDLLADLKGEKQIIPIVVDSAELKLPDHGLGWFLKKHFPKYQDLLSEVHIVFIICGLQSSSSTRFAFLLEEISSHKEYSFVLLLQDAQDKLSAETRLEELHAVSGELCDISFSEMAKFLEKNFQMPSNESEVVASRLQSVFRQFDLSAHPTYFAGISVEVIASLLHANRRAELISLAVAGFLSFVVADDKAPILLSRTTREVFLRNLIFAIKVEKRKFTRADLISFTEEFTKKNDYDIESIGFINAFVEKGILFFEGEVVIFSLQFMECFLLAKELTVNESAALSYFDFKSGEIDSETFDLYSELGPSTNVVSNLALVLQQSQTELSRFKPNRDVLSGTDVRTDFILKSTFLEGLQERIASITQKVKSNSSNKEEKQRIIDISERMSARAQEERKSLVEPTQSNPESIEDVLSKAIGGFIAAATLLGSGAERLEGKVKQPLASAMLHLGVDITCVLTTLHNEIDFESVRQEFLSESQIIDMFGEAPTESIRLQQEQIVKDLAAMIEYSFLAAPLNSLLSFLTENARNTVLAASIRQAKFDDGLPKLIAAIWLADIDSKKGKAGLVEQLKLLPSALFLKATLCVHIMHRVYWHQWKMEDRTNLLEIAEAVFKSMDTRIDKQKIERELREITGETGQLKSQKKK